MKKNIQNIFMDSKSHELIQNIITLEELNSFILNSIDTSNPLPLSIKGYLFEVEYRPNKPYLTFIYTPDEYHIVDPCKNRFKENVYLYNRDAMKSYGDFCGSEILLYTKRKSIFVVSYDGNSISKINSSNGKLIQRL